MEEFRQETPPEEGFIHLMMPQLDRPPPNPTTAHGGRVRRLKRCCSCGALKRIASPSSFSREPSSKCVPYRSLFDTNKWSKGSYQDFSPMPEKFMITNPPENQEFSQSLYKSLSDPISLDNRLGVVTKARISDQETPNSKKLRKFKERVEELRQWLGKLALEEDEDTILSQDNDNVNSNSKEKTEGEIQEAIWVEKNKEGLVLHIKCPCCVGHEIFVSGNNCSYRMA